MKTIKLIDVVSVWKCHKGCGEVELVNYGQDLICSNCGEELGDRMPSNFFKAATKLLPIKKHDEDE